jgi:prepilin-type N-terminal cleavage/methylation domain-containing protein/prepilin-type processing-associated H-X9-DG protein
MPRRSIPPTARKSTHHRHGFTLVELLVVMTIIGMLMALLLPAVQSAREAGRRTACTSNLYMLALAAIRFDEQSGFLPGWRNRGPVPRNDSLAVSWPVMLMPNMERNDIYTAWALSNDVNIQAPYVSFLVCPTSPPDTLTDSTISYAGNIGSAANVRKWDGVMHDTTITSGSNAARLSLDDISSADGTPQTLLLTERCGRMINQPRWSERFGAVNAAGPTDRFFRNDALSVAGVGIHGNPGAIKVINNIQNSGLPGFRSQPSSNHPGGVVAAFCDGHAAFLKDSVPAAVYGNLLNWNNLAVTGNPGRQWVPVTHVLSESQYK